MSEYNKSLSALWVEVATLCFGMTFVVVMLIAATGKHSSNLSDTERYAHELFAKKNPLTQEGTSICECPRQGSPTSFPYDAMKARQEEAGSRHSREEDVPSPIRILSWTAMNMASKSHEEIWFEEKGVPSLDRCYQGTNPYLDPIYERCVYTNDKSQYNISDAVLFRGRRMQQIPMPHAMREEHQYWVFWEFEPPYKVWWDANLTNFNRVFNMTATYSRDSDVPNMHYLDNICVHSERKAKKVRNVDYTWKKNQSAPISWFASVCRTQSARETYVKELMEHIDVDIYGECGPKKCGSNNLGTWSEDKCNEWAFHSNNSYKFYLAFENSLCDDYVTEKLWKIIVPPLDTVPIVLGSVDYANILPSGSYIDVSDFASPKELAEYIKYLDGNDEEYNKYLRNKNSLKCRLAQKYLPWHCRLCKNLHLMQGRKKIVYDLARFWGARRCTSPLVFHGNHRRANSDFRQ